MVAHFQQAPRSRSPPPSHASLSTQLPLLREALQHERLLVAKQDGYGTLVREGTALRNRDFTFIENELLLADYSGRPLNGKHNVTVENARGMRGDVLASLFMVVPPGLGAVSECNTEDAGMSWLTILTSQPVLSTVASSWRWIATCAPILTSITTIDPARGRRRGDE